MSIAQVIPRERTLAVLAAITLAETFMSIGRWAIGPLAPFLQADLGISRSEVGLLSSAIFLGSLVAVAPFGWIADSLSTRYLLLVGQGIVGIFLVAAAAFPFLPGGLVPLFLSGVGFGVAGPATAKAVMRWFSPLARGTAMSIKQTGVPIGAAIASAGLPAIALSFGWRPALALAGLAIAASGVVSFFLCGERSPAEEMTPAVTTSFWRAVLLNRRLLLFSATSAIWAALQACFATYAVLFLRENAGVAVVVAGGLLAASQIVGMVGRVVSGLISDRLHGGRRKPSLLCYALLMIAGPLGALALEPGAALWLVASVILIFGLAVYGWAGLSMTLAGELAGKERAGAGFGVNLALSFAAMIAVPPFFGYLVDVSGSYHTGWYTLAIGGAVSTALLLTVREGREGSRR